MASKKNFNMFDLLENEEKVMNKAKDVKDVKEKKKKHIPWSNPTGYPSWADADDEPPLDFTQPLNIKF